jgi:Trk K+ transport system NAD-binding subunit
VRISEDSPLAGQRIEETFNQFPDLVTVAIIREQRVELPRTSTCLQGKDQLLVVANEMQSLDPLICLTRGDIKKPS